MKEVRTRPRVKSFWTSVERFAVPKFRYGYTVSESLAMEFNKRYKRNYITIRNLPVLKPLDNLEREKFLLAQGAVNEARAFEWIVPAMQHIDYKLVVCGDGNFMPQLRQLIAQYQVQDKMELKGMLLPADLWPITQKAALGLGLAEREGVHQFLALPNKFFDYMHAGLPQLAMAYPEYEKINNEFKVAVLIPELAVDTIVATINEIMKDENLLAEMRSNCLRAREVYCWQYEEKKLIAYYKNIFGLE
jgi:glycosyltransferase involved in cell wall biosynthesis